ncbi:class I SAM-dependent methyltransferase [Bythopirellula polymerisocia]|uniref:Methyltransferase domain-containing protein n=1 Tax=Bythopirellula polymerisocia TaxID=2528003 RepID=A0A5C6CV04_9BACT|nr:class I SAM-dependent methyltransferase [Bythopirellula polymerisocia]TWU27261.1 hypothetical protein Pla144_20330 [Bythopirellula polymerisocia]
MSNEWSKPEHALEYLGRLTQIPHRQEGEATLISEVAPDSNRILDLGSGNGHLLNLLLAHCANAHGVGLDFSPPMLLEANNRFAGNSRVILTEHNLDEPLPELGMFDVVVSSFAIHHCEDERKRTLYQEIWNLLESAGVFCNLEHVASPTTRVHHRFLRELDTLPSEEDPSNKLLDVECQLQWLREIGFTDVDCYWKWRELALLIGRKPE